MKKFKVINSPWPQRLTVGTIVYEVPKKDRDSDFKDCKVVYKRLDNIPIFWEEPHGNFVLFEHEVSAV